jgi:carbamoyl-phosphate synthase small subunit
MQALLALEDGRIFYGRSFGHHTEVGAEIVFCTAMSGYQEVLTDPSYHGQFVVFTSPHIGNYGIHSDDYESARAWAAGAIVRDLCENPAHPDSVMSLRRYVRERRLGGLDGVDTRALTLHLRERGVMRAYLTNRVHDPDEAVALARQVPPMAERSLVADVTSPRLHESAPGREGSPHLALLDYGVKRSIVRELTLRGCRLTVLPAYTEPSTLDLLRPDGVVLSNGPGDPETLISVVGTVRHAIDRYPTLAICLGHQLVGLAMGAKIQKLRFGHHGANHPVQDLRTGFVSITSQNHNYAIQTDGLPAGVEVSHISLNDGTIEGLVDRERRLWSYQFHPEGAPGPHEARAIFDEFVAAVRSDEASRSASHAS